MPPSNIKLIPGSIDDSPITISGNALKSIAIKAKKTAKGNCAVLTFN